MNRSNQTIHNPDALMLACAAGELSESEFTELRRRMEADPALDRRVRQAELDYIAVMEQLDLLEEQTHRMDDRPALRQVDRLLHDWQAQRLTQRAPVLMERHWHVPRWTYSAAAVVAIFIGFCFWWANNLPPDTTAMAPSEITGANQMPASKQEPLSIEQMPLAFQDSSSDQMEDLSSLEQEMVAISQEGLSANNLTGRNSQ